MPTPFGRTVRRPEPSNDTTLENAHRVRAPRRARNVVVAVIAGLAVVGLAALVYLEFIRPSTSTADVAPPTVSITSPTAGQAVSGTVTVSATASDDVGITRVEFYVDDVLRHTDTGAPYSFAWPSTAGSHSLTAQAFDAADNVGRASAVNVTVADDVAAGPAFHAFGTVTLEADFFVSGAGRNVDTIAFWEAPEPTDSLMFVTSKNASLVEVWKYPFNSASAEQPPLRHRCLQAAASSATNGVLVDQETDLLYVASNRSPNVCVFSLPDQRHVQTITSGRTYGGEPNLALIRLPSGEAQLYVSNDDVVDVYNPESGQKLREFAPLTGLETMVGDSNDQVLYVPDEGGRTGIYAYDPDGSAYSRNGSNVLGDGGIFDSDAEGILVYTCPTSGSGDDRAGLIVVSDQIDSATAGNDYEVFDRATWDYLGTVKLRLPSGDFVHNTDGIGSTQPASPLYPGGLFTAISDDAGVAGVAWNKIFDAISSRTGTPFGCPG
jgi:myo-inositol-hexaphosphate 3-phosphohydrolase